MTIKEIADDEARRAELEGDDDEHDDEHEHEPAGGDELEPERQYPAEPTEAMFERALELNLEHERQLHELFGPFLEGFTECAGCGGAGIAPPTPAEPGFEQDPSKVTCEVCAGRGQLRTGSQREGYELENCDNCNGKGWVGPGNLNAVEAARSAVESVGAQSPAQPAPPSSGGPAAPALEDPRAEELRRAGYIVMQRPGG